MEGLGAYLKRERELRQISLEELAIETCIQKKFLEAIESEHFEKLPSLSYAKGFLRSYGNTIGLDSNDIILRFDALIQKMEQAGIKKDHVFKSKMNWIFIGAFFAILSLIIYWLSQ